MTVFSKIIYYTKNGMFRAKQIKPKKKKTKKEVLRKFNKAAFEIHSVKETK